MPERRGARFFPREHGFWVMASAVLTAAVIGASGQLRVWLVALGVLVIAALLGGLLRRVVRHSGTLQLASAGLLSLLGVPVDLVAGRDGRSVLVTALAWAAIFVPSALVVRSTFWRARRDESRAWLLALGSVAIATIASGGLAALGYLAQALACAVAAVGLAGVALWRPTVKQLKSVGFSLAAIALVAAGVIGL